MFDGLRAYTNYTVMIRIIVNYPTTNYFSSPWETRQLRTKAKSIKLFH